MKTCRWCKKPMTLLDRCSGLEHAINSDPALTIRMLNSSIPGSVALEKFMLQVILKGFNNLKET